MLFYLPNPFANIYYGITTNNDIYEEMDLEINWDCIIRLRLQ